MQCKHHPNRQAVHFCNSCHIPLCLECTEEVREGEFYCFQCAMFQTVSGVGSSLKDKREKQIEQQQKKDKKWGPFQYFILISGCIILVMASVILFGGQKPPLGASSPLQNDRAFIFLVDSALKRYAHHKDNQYPDDLMALVPAYLPLKKDELSHLNRLTYQKDTQEGYLLSFSQIKPGEMKVIISSKGIKYQPVPDKKGA